MKNLITFYLMALCATLLASNPNFIINENLEYQVLSKKIKKIIYTTGMNPLKEMKKQRLP